MIVVRPLIGDCFDKLIRLVCDMMHIYLPCAVDYRRSCVHMSWYLFKVCVYTYIYYFRTYGGIKTYRFLECLAWLGHPLMVAAALLYTQNYTSQQQICKLQQTPLAYLLGPYFLLKKTSNMVSLSSTYIRLKNPFPLNFNLFSIIGVRFWYAGVLCRLPSLRLKFMKDAFRNKCGHSACSLICRKTYWSNVCVVVYIN